jgi:hypothetical protein
MLERIKYFLELVHNLHTALYIHNVVLYIYNISLSYPMLPFGTHKHTHLTTALLPFVEDLWRSYL